MNLVRKTMHIGRVIIFMVMSIIYCYRNQILNNFSVIFGDKYDTIIETSILHHWKNTIFSAETWSSTQYFFPYPKTLGYNDGYFLFGILYSIFYTITHNPFISNELVGVSLHAIGFWLFYVMAYTVFGFRFSSSIFGAFVFVTSNNIWINSAHHMQILLLYLIPALIILFDRSRKNYGCGGNKYFYFYAISCGALSAACFTTAYYMSWFFLFNICIMLAVSVIYLYMNKKIRVVIKEVFVAYPVYVTLLSSFVFFMIPFLYIYLSKAHETGMHSWQDTRHYLPHPYDLFNIGAWNGEVMAAFSALNRLGQWTLGRDIITKAPYHFTEFLVGFPPVTLALAAWGAWIGTRDGAARYSKTTWLVFSSTNLIILVLCFKLGPISLWHLVFYIVPGAKGLRVVSRFFLYETLPLCIALAIAYDVLLQRKQHFLAIVLLFVVVCEQLNFSPVLTLAAQSEQKFYASIPQKPPACTTFFVADRQPSIPDRTYDLYHGNIIAMMYSELEQIPTPMGFSTFNPPDWNFNAPYNGMSGVTDITTRAIQYASTHNFLPGLCELKITTSIPLWVNLKSAP